MVTPTAPAGALAGLRVLDLSGTAATGYCGKLCADHGAEVIDVEPPGRGFPTRRLPPFAPGAAAPERSALHAYLSANKHSVELDLATDEGRAAVLRLARGADLILDGDRPGALQALGLGPGAFAAVSPDVVVASVTWFGQSGPYRDYAASDNVVQALIGMVRGVGEPDDAPCAPSGYHAQIVGGLTAYIGALGQLAARAGGNATGPAHLDASILEANVCFVDVGAVAGYSGRIGRGTRMGVNRFPPTYPLGIFPCRDGWLGVTALTPSQWHAFCRLIGIEHLKDEPAYQTSTGRLRDADRMDPLIVERVADRSARELFRRGQEMRIPLAFVPTMEQIFEVDQFVERGAFAPIGHADHGEYLAPVTPFRLFGTPAAAGGAAPRLGASNGRLEAEDRQPDATPRAAAPPRSARGSGGRESLLAGIRVVDLSMGWAGPLAARHLADMGAEVIKVESCARFDWWRGWEATREWIDAGGAEKSVAFNTVNRNKRAITLDLAKPRGNALLKRLVAESDVVVENYSADVLPKLGLSWEVLREVNPELIMISMPAFGTNGPWRGYRAYGSTVEQASGLPHLSGRPEWKPTMVHVAYGDAVGGLNGAAALLTALRHKLRTGQGQYLDLSQAECLFPLGVHGILAQSATGSPPERLGNRSPEHAPHGVFPCAGDDEWIVIQVLDEAQWSRLQALVGEDLAAFGEVGDRLRRVDALEDALSGWTQSRDPGELMTLLQGHGIPAACVNAATDLFADPQLAAREFWPILERAHVGKLPHPVPPYRTSASPFGIERPAPTLGEHNREVLTALLGLDDAEIATLERDGIIGTKPVLG